MKKITFLLLFPFLAFGQNITYSFDTTGDREGFSQGGITFDVPAPGGALVCSSFGAGGFHQLRTPTGLNLNESVYTKVRIVVENLLTTTGPVNFETFKIINYDKDDPAAAAAKPFGPNVTIPYGSGFQTLTFDIPVNPDLGGVIDRIGLRFQAGGGSGLSGTFTIDEFVILDNTLSTDSNVKSNFSVYPNPVKDVVKISGANAVSEVAVYDLTGKSVIPFTKIRDNELDISSLNTGMYMLKIAGTNGDIETKKLVKN